MEATPEARTPEAHMEALLTHVVRSLVQVPDQVRVTSLPRRSRDDRGRDERWRDERPRGGAPNFDLRVAPVDFPRVVGRGGRTARALRVLLEGSFIAQGGDDYDRPGLNIVDPEDDGQPV